MADSLTIKLQKQFIREDILNRWDIKIPASRAAKLSLDQLKAIQTILTDTPVRETPPDSACQYHCSCYKRGTDVCCLCGKAPAPTPKEG